MAVAATDRHVELRAFSRPWWALWIYRADRGQAVEPMVAAARRGAPWRVPRQAAVSDVGLIAIDVGSEGFNLWAEHFERRGVRLPRPSRAAVIFMPRGGHRERRADGDREPARGIA